MKKESYYEKYIKKKKLEEKNKEIVVEKPNNLVNTLSFFMGVISKIYKTIIYLVLIILCSLGATYLINNILNIKIL